MSTWITVATNDDADQLMSLFGGFGDSCISGAQIWTNHYVNSDSTMSVDGGLDTCATFIIQRQQKDPSCIELQFKKVMRFNYVPTPENYDSIIFDASITANEGGITWLINPVDTLEASIDTWVSAKEMKYRIADELLGPSRKAT